MYWYAYKVLNKDKHCGIVMNKCDTKIIPNLRLLFFNQVFPQKVYSDNTFQSYIQLILYQCVFK